jgi:pimeloyl-ACP methyl ester carboxylesterase
VLDHAAVLARHGYGVLLADARGHGRSGGRAMDFGWFGDEDIAAALDFLAARAEVDPTRLAVLGLSMGGEEAIGAAATDARIRAVVAEGATNRTAADGEWLADAFGFRGWLQQRVDEVTEGVTDLLTEADPPVALRTAVARADRPVLLVTAGDVRDELRAATWIQRGAPDDVTIWEVADTGHTGALMTHPDEWERRVTAFLEAALPDA